MEKRHSVSEIVSLECVFFVESPRERKSFAHSLLWSARKGIEVFEQAFGCKGALVDFDDHAFAVDEEGRRHGELAAAIEEVTIKDVVDADDLLCTEQCWEREVFLHCK